MKTSAIINKINSMNKNDPRVQSLKALIFNLIKRFLEIFFSENFLRKVCHQLDWKIAARDVVAIQLDVKTDCRQRFFRFEGLK